MVRNVSCTDLTQGLSLSYNRALEKEGKDQRVEIVQETYLIKQWLNAGNSAMRRVSPNELIGIFKDKDLREHNQRAFDFFVKFKNEQVEGNTYLKVFQIAKAIASKIEEAK